MRRIDELFTQFPFLGSRRLALMLGEQDLSINRKRMQRLMRLMGIAALGPKPRTTRPAPGHKVYPYLLRGLAIDRPNQVWAADITYVPMGAASCTWWRSWTGPAGRCWRGGCRTPWTARSASRRWRRRLARFGRAGDLQHRPGQPVHQRCLHRRFSPRPACASMDGRGRWMDNVFIERLWRC